MRLWADVYDAAGRKRGDGPVTSLLSASVERALDGAGSLDMDAPLTDARARALLVNEARPRVFVEDAGAQRELGRGVVRGVRLSGSAEAFRLRADGPDALDELKRVNTLLGRAYSGQTVEAVARALAALAGWRADIDGGEARISARFDGASVLKALQMLCEQQGLHLRLGGAGVVEIGAFGAPSGLTLVAPALAAEPLYHNDDVAVVESITVAQDSEAVANWLLPVGAGEGEAALTLEKSTRSAPYPIQTVTGPDGRTLYFLVDDASAAAYGVIQKVGTFKNIAPVTNSDGDMVNAANALYDAAAAWLARYSVRQDTYRVTLRKARRGLRPGDTVRLVYRGVVERDGEPYTYLDVHAAFWILKAREQMDGTGITTALEISTVDRYAEDAARIVIGALEAIELRNVFVQPYPSTRSFVRYEEMDSTHSVKIPVKITDATLDLTRAQLTLKTRPLRATATAAAGGGSHRHMMMRYNGTTSSGPPTQNGLNFQINRSDSDSDNQNVIAWGFDQRDIWTFSASGTHTHPLTYGIHDDTLHPQSISVHINGVDVTAALGGPWAAANAPATVELDITAYLRGAAGGLRQEHEVEVRCASGQGTVESLVELFEVVQAIKL